MHNYSYASFLPLYIKHFVQSTKLLFALYTYKRLIRHVLVFARISIRRIYKSNVNLENNIISLALDSQTHLFFIFRFYIIIYFLYLQIGSTSRLNVKYQETSL